VVKLEGKFVSQSKREWREGKYLDPTSFINSAVAVDDTPAEPIAGIPISTENDMLAPMDVDSGGIFDNFNFNGFQKI